MKMFECAGRHPERILCVCDDGSKVRYQELLDAAAFYRENVGHEMVFVLCRNTPGSLLGYLGCLLGGGAALLLDADMEPALFENLYRKYRPAWICAPRDVSPGTVLSDTKKNESANVPAGTVLSVSPGTVLSDTKKNKLSNEPAGSVLSDAKKTVPNTTISKKSGSLGIDRSGSVLSDSKKTAQIPALTKMCHLEPSLLTHSAVFRDSLLIRTGEEGPAIHPDLCLLLTTSGSTGSPKLVRISRQNLDANAASIVQYLGIDESERPITTLPMNYSYGMSVINTHVWCGATILLTQHTFLEKAFWKRVRDGRATSLAGVPYTYRILDRIGLTGENSPMLQGSVLRTLTQAGGKLPEELHRKFGRWCQETGRRFFIMYGQTEASPRMGYLPPEHALDKCGSTGVAIPGGRLVLTDEEGNEITEPGVTGELIYYGHNVSMGYAECRRDLLLGDERGGILYTGDMAHMDEDGFFYITGRKKRFIKIAGRRLGLDEAERLLSALFPEEEIACAGSDDHLSFYVCGADDVRLEEIAERLADMIHVTQSMIFAYSVDVIPRNEAGKVQYTLLESQR